MARKESTPELTRADRVRWGRIGGLTKASRHSPDEMTGAARRGFLERFERQVDPDGTLEPAERARRAEAARKAHMLTLSARSAIARRRRGSEEDGRASAVADAP